MIAINIRGTGGSGKSTLVKKIVELYPYHQAVVIHSVRKRPLGYLCGDDPHKTATALNDWEATPPKLWVPGHYETACGGCDTIKTVDEVYRMVNDGLDKGRSVLYEGIMVQDDVRRAVELDHKLRRVPPPGSQLGVPLTQRLYVIALSTPIEECLAAIRERRRIAAEAKGKTAEPLNEKNTRARYETVLRNMARLKDAGVHTERLDRNAAFNCVRELLGV